MNVRVPALLPIFLFALLFAGCGSGGSGGSGGGTGGSGPFTVGGFVNDLTNSPVTLLNNGTDTVTLPTYGAFTFPTRVANGATYNVTVGKQPTNGQICQVQNGTGTVTANVNSVLVTCLGPFTIGGSVYGLLGSGLTLQDNGGDTLPITSNGTFQFAATIPFGGSYDVTVASQPMTPQQICRVTLGSGTPQQSVTAVQVSCTSAEAQWIWMGGSQQTSLMGNYGVQGVAAASNNPGARKLGMSWTDPAGTFWLFGGTIAGEGDNLNDLWKYNGVEWTWVNGSSTGNNPLGVYGTQGTPSAANFPGAREDATAWTDSSGNLWLFGGYGDTAVGNVFFNDLWRFSSNEWTWVSGSNEVDQPPVYGTQGVAAAGKVPGARFGAASWIDASNNLWLFGGNDVNIYGSGGSSRVQNDLWKFDGKEWTWVSGSNDPTNAPTGIYGTLGVPATTNVPGGRYDAATWIDAVGALWLFGGTGQDSTGTLGTLNDLWRFKDGMWTWMGGSNVAGDLGTFGTMGVASAANVPSARANALAWTDASGNFWLFGGGGADRSGGDGSLNDLWKYSGGNWTYESGSQLAAQPPNYGPLGVLSAQSLPGGCSSGMQWIDKSGKLWAYCENDNDQEGLILSANDLWVYQP